MANYLGSYTFEREDVMDSVSRGQDHQQWHEYLDMCILGNFDLLHRLLCCSAVLNLSRVT